MLGYGSRDSNNSIAVCIPSYNHARFVDQCIRSVLDQSVEPNEIIVRDDCSTDASWEKLQKYNAHIMVRQNSENVGIYENYRRLVDECKSSYAVLLSSDDLMHPDMVRHVRNRLRDVQCLVTGSFQLSRDGKNPDQHYAGGSYALWPVRSRSTLKNNVAHGSIFSFPGSVWQVSWLRTLPRLPENAHLATDWYWQMMTAAYGRYAFDFRPLHAYRFHTANTSHSNESLWRIHAENMLGFVLKMGMLPAEMSRAVELTKRDLERGRLYRDVESGALTKARASLKCGSNRIATTVMRRMYIEKSNRSFKEACS